MTNEELLACATCFDLGPAPIVNGRLADETYADYEDHRIRVERRFNKRTALYTWAIFDGFQDLNSSGNWEVRGRTNQGGRLDRCRYDTAQEAISHYLRWKQAILAWANKKIAKARPGKRVVLNTPKRFKLPPLRPGEA